MKKTKKMKKTGKKFLYDKKNPKKSMSIFTDENTNDTIPLKYKNMKELKETILKLEKLFKNKKYPHKRILQVAMIMKIRLQIIFEKYKKGDKRYKLAKKYFTFLKKRTKQNTYNKRKNMIFKI